MRTRSHTSAGLPLGFITNAPDQLKTIIQSGSALNMRQALRQQAVSKGGLSAMFGRAALYRASYIAHAVRAWWSSPLPAPLVLTANAASGGTVSERR